MTATAPTVALIHAVLPALPPMREAFDRELPGARLLNLLDDGLLTELERHGGLAPACVDRLATLVGLGIAAGAGAVLLTCTAYSPVAGEVQARFPDVPVLAIDQVLVEEAVARASRIGVLATAPVGLTQQTMLRRAAERRGKAIAIVPSLHPEAMAALQRGDGDAHDRILLATLPALAAQVELVLLAQASMARLAPKFPPDLPAPVLTSPTLAAQRVRALLADRRPADGGDDRAAGLPS